MSNEGAQFNNLFWGGGDPNETTANNRNGTGNRHNTTFTSGQGGNGGATSASTASERDMGQLATDTGNVGPEMRDTFETGNAGFRNRINPFSTTSTANNNNRQNHFDDSISGSTVESTITVENSIVKGGSAITGNAKVFNSVIDFGSEVSGGSKVTDSTVDTESKVGGLATVTGSTILNKSDVGGTSNVTNSNIQSSSVKDSSLTDCLLNNSAICCLTAKGTDQSGLTVCGTGQHADGDLANGPFTDRPMVFGGADDHSHSDSDRTAPSPDQAASNPPPDPPTYDEVLEEDAEMLAG